jgi:SagB-type dehydrogenase family enzyme
MHNSDTDVARHYHEETKHSYESVRRGAHFLDWDNQPLPFKLYRDLERTALPDVGDAGRVSALESLESAPATSSTPPRLVDLARLLHYAAGVTKKRRHPGGEILFRAAACTGALYHVELYVVSGPVDGLETGVYHYGPKDSVLSRLRKGDWREALVHASGSAPSLKDAALALVFTTTYWRNAWKYRARAYRHAFWDSGTILANLLAMASALDLPARLVLGFADENVNQLLDLDADKESAVGIVALGSGGGTVPSAPGPAQHVGLETVRSSRTELDYPAIRRAHHASSLTDAREARAWRESGDYESTSPGEGRLLEPLSEEDRPSDSIEAVIRKRGSARRFERGPIGYRELSTILSTAVVGLPADVRSGREPLNDVYLIVNDVSDLPSGAYAYHAGAQALELLKKGEFRGEARHLDLEQDLAGDASVNVYMLVSLERVLSRFGNRGYRLAQLEGGFLAGRMYLAAYALGLGATGLTFFDDDVTEFFSPHATGKAVMFLLAIGIPASRKNLSST